MIYKERMSYYDMDEHTAQLYAPIDEYLRQTKRFSPKAMKRKYIGIIAGMGLGLSVLLIGTAAAVFTRSTITVIFSVTAAGVLTYMMYMFIKNFGEEPDTDMLTCENILDSDGVEEVYKEYTSAVRFGKNSLISNRYLFIKGRTLLRIRQMTRFDIHSVQKGESRSYYFRVHVNDELGERAYDVEYLGADYSKHEHRFRELLSTIEYIQRMTGQTDT